MNDLASVQRLKKVLIGVWIFAGISFLPPFNGWSAAAFGQSLFGLLVVIHAIECVVFLGTLRATGNPLLGELWQTLVFGVLHQKEIQLAKESAGGD